MTNNSKRTPWLGIGLLLVVVGLAVWLLSPPQPPGPRPVRPEDPSAVDHQPLDRTSSLRLIELRNLGLGYLENHKFDEASKAFQDLLAVLPSEPFAVRNLAVSHVKQATEAIDDRAVPQGFAQAKEAGLKAIQMLADQEPESAFPHFLRAVLATKTGDPSEIVKHLKAATERDPDNVAWKFQWFELGRALRDPVEKTAAFDAGLSAAALAPDNLFVQKEVLAENLTILTDLAKKSPDEASVQAEDLLARLEKLRDPLRVLGVSIQVQAKIDIVAVLDTVLAAIRDNQWQKARNEFFKIKNLLSQETASDADLIHPHPLTYHDPLNYVALDFSPAFYERADLPNDTLPKIEVTWKETEGVLPEVSSQVIQLAWLDFDLDGVDDLVELGSNGLMVHRRLPELTGWEQIVLELEHSWSGFLSADLDDDVVNPAEKPGESKPVTAEHCHEADLDFILYGRTGVTLVNNVLDDETKSRRLETIPAEKAGFGELKNVVQAKLVDFDHDGDLDLVTIADGQPGLWINLGNYSFLNVNDRSILPPNGFRVTSVAAVDWDQDNDVDILLSATKGSGWLENLRHGRLRFHQVDEGWPAADDIQVAELNGDGNWDLVLIGGGTVFHSEDGYAKVLLTERGFGGLPKVKASHHIAQGALRKSQLLDYDNDGAIDLCLIGPIGGGLWRNVGTGEFQRRNEFSVADALSSDEQVFADIDLDGDLDCISASDGKLHLLTNEGGNHNHWLNVRFRGQQVKANEQGASKRVNHYGIGNTVEVKAGTRYQAQIADGPTTRFGLGLAEKADIVRVLATNGVPQNRIEPKANELICERQILLSSCPYLYTWNGSRYEFVTDLVWASPLGLKASQTELVPWRDWEYLKIDGSKLQPIDGEYRLQITEELWEAGYFDQVKLFAIDHPSDTQIFTNEKVGSPALAAHKIHTVREPKLPKAVRDQAGRDWLSQLSLRDENYTRTYDRKLAQGLCSEHYLELDLGELIDPQQITLFLTGWVRPTDTNINVALDQNPDLPLPAGLALWTPDADGAWREVSPHVGFPNGKTKTIAIDLSQAFTPGNYRLGLVSNREFYWDQAFFTVDDEPVEIREYELPLLKADLHDRGVSRGILPAGDGPETYDYDQLAAIPPWPKMDGMFTRFGDVRPLLHQRDDRLMVIGAGDEASLVFAVPPEPLPDGWTRDFVLYNVGWVKDCLLNTWEGQRVEPLPFADLNGHDYWTGRPEETAEYAEYLRTYQTRRQISRFRPFVRRWASEMKPTIPAWERDRRTGD